MNYQDSNAYASPYSGQMAADAAEQDRIGFIQRTYLHLGLAILAFVTLEAAIFTAVPEETLMGLAGTLTQGWNWAFVLGGFMGASWIAHSLGRVRCFQHEAVHGFNAICRSGSDYFRTDSGDRPISSGWSGYRIGSHYHPADFRRFNGVRIHRPF